MPTVGSDEIFNLFSELFSVDSFCDSFATFSAAMIVSINSWESLLLHPVGQSVSDRELPGRQQRQFGFLDLP
jgi:hypothetical protein